MKDAETHRGALVEKWIVRSRAIVAAAEGDAAAKVHLAECAPPGTIQQGQLGPDEVLLLLPLQCKIEGNPTRADR